MLIFQLLYTVYTIIRNALCLWFERNEVERKNVSVCACYFLQLKSEVIYNENDKNWGFQIPFLFVCWSKRG